MSIGPQPGDPAPSDPPRRSSPPPAEPPAPASVTQALGLLHSALDFLTSCNAPELPAAVQAEALISLERVDARRIAARSRILRAFAASHGYEADGQYAAGSWLRAFTGVTQGQSAAEGAWSPARAAAGPGSCYLTGADAEAWACDALIQPVVAGHIDWQVLDELTGLFLDAWTTSATPGQPGPAQTPDSPAGPSQSPATDPATAPSGGTSRARGIEPLPPPPDDGPPGQDWDGRPPGREWTATLPGPLPSETLRRLQNALINQAADLISGPWGIASLRRRQELGWPFSGASLPLDIGKATAEVPPHLRKAVISRDRHCRFPGCYQPPAVSQVHHLIPRAKGGPAALWNLGLFCRFHHLVAIHRWGWRVTLHPDGTSTAVGPDGRILYSHGPPGLTA